MKIVIATPILYNSISPFNHLFKDIIGGFLEDGNQVVRLVAVENDIDIEYKYGFENENIKYKLYKRKSCAHGNIVSRFLRDTLTNIREAIGILKLKDVDILFEDVSYSSFWTVKAAKLKGIKIVAMLQDVWPDNAVQSHLISEDSFVYKFFEMWQKSVYKNADKLICISDDMKDFIVSKGINEDKIEVIYNWGYSDNVVEIPWENNKFVEKYNLKKDKFYAIYAGNIGNMQNVEIVVNAAKELQDHEDIQFLIVGEGVRREAIEKMAQGLKNVTMLPMQPNEIATHIYSAAGVNIIPLVPGGTKTAMPSKTGVALSCGQPVIFCFDSSERFIKAVEKSKAGAVVNPEDAFALATEILKLVTKENKVKEFGLFYSTFCRRTNIEKYEKSIRRLYVEK